MEQTAEIGEIGARIQLAPNTFAAMAALGVGENARRRAVFTEHVVMKDAVDGEEVATFEVGEAFRKRFGNPYAVIHRDDIHLSLYEAVKKSPLISFHTSVHLVDVEDDGQQATVIDREGRRYSADAAIGCDGVKSVVRDKLIGDQSRVSGHVVYRAVMPVEDMPEDLRWNAPAVWAGPNCHVVHYPLRGGQQYNLVMTFHSCEEETWGVREGSRKKCCPISPGSATAPRVCSPSRLPGSGGAGPTAARSRPGAAAASRCWALPPIQCCNTWHRALAWRSEMRSPWVRRSVIAPEISRRRSSCTKNRVSPAHPHRPLGAVGTRNGSHLPCQGIERVVRNSL